LRDHLVDGFDVSFGRSGGVTAKFISFEGRQRSRVTRYVDRLAAKPWIEHGVTWASF